MQAGSRLGAYKLVADFLPLIVPAPAFLRRPFGANTQQPLLPAPPPPYLEGTRWSRCSR